MKHNILIIILLFCGVNYAQEADSTQVQQEAVHLREIPKFLMVVNGGIANPLGDFKDIARTGLNIGLGADINFTNKWGASLMIRHTYNEFGFNKSVEDPSIISSTNNNWNSTALSAGPTYTYTNDRFELDVITRLGIAYLNEPENVVTATDNNTIVNLYSFDSDNSKSAAAVLELGLRFNYYFRRTVQLHFSPQYQTTLGSPIAYKISDGSSILKSNSTNFSNILFNVGLKISIGKKYSNGEFRIDEDM